MYKYLKISSDFVWGKNVLSREDLVQAKNKSIDVIVNTENSTQFDPEKNEWVEIKGDD